MTLRKNLVAGECPPPPESDPRYASLKTLRKWLLLELYSVSNLIDDWEFDAEHEMDSLTIKDLENSIADILLALGEAIENFYEANKDNPFLKTRVV